MSLDIDGFAVLRGISAHPRAFADVAAEIGKAARTIVIKQLKGKNSDLRAVREVCRALGADPFSLIVDGMTDAQIKPLIAKLDKHHPDLKTANPQWRRQHLRALADGAVESTAKPKSTTRRKGKKEGSERPSEPPDLLSFKSAGATRKR